MSRDLRVVIASALVLAMTIGGAAPAAAITWGDPDVDGRFPAVGAIIVDWRVIGVPEFGIGVYCSGTLIHLRVFLTAGHCAEGLVADGITDADGFPVPSGDPDIWVSFHEDPSLFDPAPGTTRCATCRDIVRVVNHPDYRWGPTSDPHDIAAIILAEPVTDIAPMPVAGLGALEDLRRPQARRDGANREAFTVVGYGGSFVDPPPWDIEYRDHRRFGQSSFQGLLDVWLRVSQNQARGDQGTCYGDSGGPMLRGTPGSYVVAAVTSWGDVPCVSMGFYYRTDTPSSQDFIAGVIALAGG